MHLVACALVVKGQSNLSRMMNLVLLCSELKFRELWLNQKGLALVARALAVKGQCILWRTWTLRSDNAVVPVHHQNRTKRGSRANCQRWEHLSALTTFKFSVTITHTPGILTSGDFYQGRSGGHVVPRWKSPDVMFSVSSGWKSPQIMVSVSSGENHPTLWLEWVFCFPVDALTLSKLTKLHSFIVFIFQFGRLNPPNPPCGDGTGRMWDMKVNSSAAINLIAQQL